MIAQAVINGLTIGTYASGYIFTRTSGFDFPETTIDVKSRGIYHGAVIGDKYYGRRAMAIEGEIIGSSPSDYETKRQALEKSLDIMNGEQVITFTCRSGLVVETTAIVSQKIDAPYESGKMIRGNFRIDLVSAYPFLESITDIVEDVTIGTGGGGAVPMAIPFDMTAGATGDTIIANDGNAPAYPTIRIYGAIENPTLSNLTTGKTLSVNYTLTSETDYIDIDIYNRTAKTASGGNIKRYVTGDWFTLIAGNNTIKLTGSNDSENCRAEFTYRDSYLGV